MPGGDRTGPAGAGPMTGRGAGYCGGSRVPGYANRVAGGQFGGWGRGRGWRHGYYATGLTRWQRGAMGPPAFGAGGEQANPGAEAMPASAPGTAQGIDQLQRQAAQLASTLETISKRIEQLEKKLDVAGSE